MKTTVRKELLKMLLLVLRANETSNLFYLTFDFSGHVNEIYIRIVLKKAKKMTTVHKSCVYISGRLFEEDNFKKFIEENKKILEKIIKDDKLF